VLRRVGGWEGRLGHYFEAFAGSLKIKHKLSFIVDITRFILAQNQAIW